MRINDPKVTRILAHLFFIVWGCLSSVSALAAASNSAELSALPWSQIGLGSLLSLWGGITSTAEKALEFAKIPQNKRGGAEFLLTRELLKDVIVSSGIGFLIFGAGVTFEWGVWTMGTALWLGGYAGTRFLIALRDAGISWVTRKGADQKL